MNGINEYSQSYYNFLFKHGGNNYIYNSKINSLAELEEDVWNMFKLNLIDNLVTRSDFSDMLDNGFIHSNSVSELKEIFDVFNDDREYKKNIALTIVLTMNCNLRCVYCYQNNSEIARIESRRISDETIFDLLNFLKKHDKVENLEVTWFGGEPLLEIKKIVKISEKLIDFCSKNKISYTASIITNGYLLNEKNVKILLKYNVNDIQVTLDGTKKMHDIRRIHVNPIKSSYDRIINFLKMNEAEFFHINIRINIDRLNILYIDNLLKELKLVYKNNMTIEFARVESYNDNCNNCFDVFTEEEFANLNLKLKTKLIEYNLIPSAMLFYPKNIASYCGATRKSSLMIDYRGNIFKCWCDLEDINKSAGSLKENVLKPNIYTSYSLDSDSECMECKKLPLCMGGCLYYKTKGKKSCPDIKYTLIDSLKLFLDANKA